MIRLPVKLFPIVFSVILLSSCSQTATSPDAETDNDNEEPQEEVTTGTLAAGISTEGSEIDPDGYTIILNDSEDKSAASQDTVYYAELEATSHEVELSGIAENCEADGKNPKSFDITAGDTTAVAFSIQCEATGPAPIVNAIAYESTGESGGYSKIYLMNEDGSNPEMLHEVDGGNAMDPDISPDGQSIVFSAGDFIYIMDSEGSNIEQLTSDEDDAEDFGPVFSPDGTKIAFERDEDIFVMNTDGSDQQNITNSIEYFEQDPAWSPDGTQIVFVRGIDDSYNQDAGNLVVMEADGSNITPLTESPDAIDRAPEWSPDGSQIAFARQPDSDSPSNIHLINSDASGFEAVTDHGTNATSPSWAPEGDRLAYVLYEGNDDFIHLLTLETGESTAIDNGTILHGGPDWSPVTE